MSSKHRLRHDTKEIRQKEAKERQTDYNKLSVKQKIAKLDTELGQGIGASKQRAKLHKLQLVETRTTNTAKSEKEKPKKPEKSKKSKK